MREELHGTTAAVARIEQDLLAERVGRIEDLELVIDLLAKGLDAVRTDVARLSERLEGIAAAAGRAAAGHRRAAAPGRAPEPVLADRAGARERRARAGRHRRLARLLRPRFTARYRVVSA